MIDIKSVDFKITDAIRYEIQSMQDAFTKHISGNERIRVVLSKVAPDVFNVQMHSHFLGDEIISQSQSHNFHKALELCKNHFIRLVDKRKNRIRSRGKNV